ncbi:MAG TPA: CsbD family protein [Terriglobales bacterium]
MNWDQVEGKWKQMKGDIRTRWGKLTDDDLHVIGGEKDKLVGRIQERYGIQKDEAQRQVDDWHRNLGESNEELRMENERQRKAS